jgi:hypothetical protein
LVIFTNDKGVIMKNTKVKVIWKDDWPLFLWKSKIRKLLNYCFQDAKDKSGQYSNHELANRRNCKTIWSWFQSIKQRSHCFGEYYGTKQDIFPSNHHNKNMFFLL